MFCIGVVVEEVAKRERCSCCAVVVFCCAVDGRVLVSVVRRFNG